MGKIAGAILQAALRANGFLNKPSQPLQQQQQKVLYQLLQRAAHTAFGKHYLFSHWLTMPAHEQYQAFAQTIPLHTYEQMFTQWWHRIITGEPSVCWPGITRYMALTSGTSMAGSKYIPLTPQSMSSVKQAGLQLATALAARPGLSGLFGLKTISIGGSTRLSNQGAVQVGDFSGIMMRQNPGWYQRLIIPPPAIHALKQWPQKLEYLVECAPQFNPGSVSGFPVWVVPLLQAIISRYKLAHIHQLWPGLQVYLYGGMAVQPYQSSLQACFGKPVHLFETYVASEGYIAHQTVPGQPGMQLVANGGLFMELVPFNHQNFDHNGQPLPLARAIPLWQANVHQPYALVLSGNNGTWRYLLGDVISVTSLQPPTISWLGRTSQFLNLAGEHLSIANLEAAFAQAALQLGLPLQNFAVQGITQTLPPCHTWWVQSSGPTPLLAAALDAELAKVNDDYAALRAQGVLASPQVKNLPANQYLAWMHKLGKTDAQHKYPRVVTEAQVLGLEG